ncbi:IMAP FAMILY MEMBER 1 putative-RELATED [Salix koriyanagi]|uniref:IMAP FAMILY MEMBER 1 putative-RELATED n=1 Tax=Salix koriyanagi TaxID=2511006 RepID=A0A9Q0UQB3_9ROSI|nr:IMAP FAMILY MEMBER 1 putative-RELATED [Salix koriyanagi]
MTVTADILFVFVFFLFSTGKIDHERNEEQDPGLSLQNLVTNNISTFSLIVLMTWNHRLRLHQDNSNRNSEQTGLLSLGTAAIFAALFTSHFIGAKKQDASRLLEKVAFFLAATTFFFAIATPFPLGIKCAIWAVYIIALVAIAICNFL